MTEVEDCLSSRRYHLVYLWYVSLVTSNTTGTIDLSISIPGRRKNPLKNTLLDIGRRDKLFHHTVP